MAEDVPVSFCPSCGLYLKMEARINIEVRLPEIRNPGVSVSNWEIMEKLKIQSEPEEYVSLRVSLSSRELIRFEGEFDSVRALKKVVLMINGRTIKLKGFSDPLKIKASIANEDRPMKHEWEDYFIGKGIETFDEGKPGERPDTIHVKGLPVKWFVSKTSEGKPCSKVITQAFQKFGQVRQVGFYDPSGRSSSTNFSSFGPGSGSEVLNFEAYIQFEKYNAFCSAMDGLAGMKLMRLQAGGKAETPIKVDFDKSGFLSDRGIRKRLILEERRRKEIELEEKRMEEIRKEEEIRKQEEQLAKEKEEEEKRQVKLEERKQKKIEQEKIAMELKKVALLRRQEAQRLMRVLLAGAAEERYQEERNKHKRKERKKVQTRTRSNDENDGYIIEELKKKVKKLEEEKFVIQKEFSQR